MLKVRDKQTASMQTRDKVRLDADILYIVPMQIKNFLYY